MKINDHPTPGPGEIPIRAFNQNQPHQEFSKMLDAERLRAENSAATSDILAGQKSRPESEHKDDVAYIKEHGVRAYAEEVHKQKIEELREKLLAAMGLSEEALAEMPSGQRAAIEKMIAEEIQKRLAAASMTNGGSGPEGSQKRQASVAEVGSGNLLAAQVVAGETGSVVGLILTEIDAENEALVDRKNSGDDR
jgi:hypothetical protein